jgi:tetratricopeptide (TPR) repeat protein
MGVLHVEEKDLAAAERKFRRALRVNAAFAPAHLNLAHCLLRRGEQEEAVREVLLAEAFNVGNVFGLSRQISECKRACGIELGYGTAVRLDPAEYRGREPEDVVDQRMVALMEGLAKYAVEDLERAKILNNLAVHFADSGKTELALDHFRSALAVLKFAGPERFDVARQVFANMSEACRAAGFTEADEYDQMLDLVLP